MDGREGTKIETNTPQAAGATLGAVVESFCSLMIFSCVYHTAGNIRESECFSTHSG